MNAPINYAMSGVGSSFLSIYDHMYKDPRAIDKILKRFSDDYDTYLLDILRSFQDRSIMVSGNHYQWQEEDYDNRSFTIGVVTSVVDGGLTINFKLNALDVGNDGALVPNYFCFLRPGFYFQIGDAESGFAEARIVSVTYDGAANFDINAHIYDAAAPVNFATFYPDGGGTWVGAELAITSSAYATATAHPMGVYNGTIEKTAYLQIFKETKAFEGMNLAMGTWIMGQDGRPFYNTELVKAERSLDRQLEAAYLMGYEENGASTTQTSLLTGHTNPVYKTGGIWHKIDAEGGELTYTAGSFDMDDLDSVSDYLLSQRLMDKTVIILQGKDLSNELEHVAVDYVSGAGAGSLNVSFTEVYGMGGLTSEPNIILNIGFKAFKKSGILFLLKDLPAFNDPAMFGIDSYRLKGSAIVMPFGRFKGEGGKIFPNVFEMYMGVDSYSRKRIIRFQPGTDGFLDGRLAAVEGDYNKSFITAHTGIGMAVANQGMLIKSLTP